jgi:hypothetical protein
LARRGNGVMKIENMAPATRPNARKPATGWPGRRPSRAGLRERVGRDIPAVGHAGASQGAGGCAGSVAIGPDHINETARRFTPAGFFLQLQPFPEAEIAP